ncbi:MAG: 5'/3'-nucleotidase SurE [Actinobacteria bacterium]|nr:5'/3'-nucleotidase SurE [Actinomycetota bacterium]
MRALITNDDGIDSPGVRILAQVAVAAGLDVTVAAPNGERSGTSAMMSALEAGGKLLVEERKLDGLEDVPTVAVQATPAMIAFVGLHGGFGERPGIILAGINRGPNLGRAILHSGTVGAALTGASAGLPTMAFSLARDAAVHWDTAEQVAARALDWYLGRAVPGVVINVNVPDRTLDQVQGLRAARLTAYGAAKVTVGERQDGYVPVTFAQVDDQVTADSDWALVREGWATVTAVHGIGETTEVDLGTLPAGGF